MRIKLLFILGIVTGACWYGAHWYLSKPQLAAPKPPPSVKITTVQRQDVSEDLELIGNLVALESVSIKSRLDSQIMEVLVKDGDKVQKGQKLFKLDDRVIKAQLEEAVANLVGNKAEFERAEKQYKRDSDLVKTGVTAQKQFDTSKQTLDAARASVAATQAKIDLYKTQLEFTDITSPIVGRIGAIKITNGNVVKANDTIALAIINQIDPIKLEISLPQRYFDRLKNNSDLNRVTFKLLKTKDAQINKNSLQSIDNQIDENTRSLTLRAVLNNKNEKLWPGMFVDVSLSIEQAKEALTIPLKAIQRTQKGEAIFKLEKDIAKLVAIKTKFISGDLAVLEEGALNVGDQVVTEGAFNLQDGMKVNLVSENKS